LGAAPELGLAVVGLLGAAAGGLVGSGRRRPRVGTEDGGAPRGAADEKVVAR
jgi:hypothetical protein